ncbi:DUF2460 domain-containing protein [Neptunicoccus sediminis]|uniref:DUF2460 domain-containing protein n=1 Tax=Neptunicoccus sediminis TaxID=1892596 RepID=UPI0008460537|nr:DUF2460 domain-containing protein [Neptunicoccus sediminis]
MNFHEVRFPAGLSFGSTGGPERRTEIVTLNSGYEERNSPWAHARRRYDAGVAMRSTDDLEAVIAFFEARRGRLFGFRWKDWTDCKSCLASREPAFADQEIAVGDSVTLDIALCKTYRSGETTYCRAISKPVEGTVSVGIGGAQVFEGEHFDVDYTSGVIRFYEAPPEAALVTAGFAFDVPVRFDTDRLEMSMAGFAAGSVPSVPIVEVRV